MLIRRVCELPVEPFPPFVLVADEPADSLACAESRRVAGILHPSGSPPLLDGLAASRAALSCGE